jgi:branched-chain amino acid transport system ATP-binding protein
MSALKHPVVTAALAMAVLPFVLLGGGLTLTSATDVVIIAIACMALNILVGHTGLVSFGHGAWFGLGAYAAALTQKYWFPGSVLWPSLCALAFLLAAAVPIGFLVLRRRGVYFSLLTLAFSALTYAVAFRWTSFTGGESGLGGVTRANWFGLDLENRWVYYALVGVIGLAVVHGVVRFHRSPIGTVLVAIRENEQRAQFLGYATNRYKQIAYVVSATLTGIAGVLFAFHHRFASADPTAVSFSGELLAMVIIGGMRSLLGPALGALFYILFREYLSIWTPNWLLFFGLLFVGFIVFSPTGLTGVWRRLTEPLRPRIVEAAAMSGRAIEQDVPLPEFLRPRGHASVVLEARDLAKSFGGIKAVVDASLTVGDRTLHALIGPNGAGKTTVFNLVSGMYAPDRGSVELAGRQIAGVPPHQIAAAGLTRSFQITNLFPGVSIHENLRLAVQAHDQSHFDGWADAYRNHRVHERTAELIRFLGLSGIEQAEAGALSYGGQRLLDMGLALAGAPRLLLLDEPLAGLAAAERERVAGLIKRISSDLPVLLVEHDIDRVFALADRVTVMNEGKVLVDGPAAQARESQAVREVYIGSGTAALAAKPRGDAGRASGAPLLDLEAVDAFYGKSHIVKQVSLAVHEREIVALLGRNGAGKSTLLKTIIGIVAAQGGRVALGGADIAGRPPALIARAGVGYVPQGRGLFAGMSVRHNLELGRLKRRGGTGVAWSDAKILEFFPRLRERLDTPADFLSGGEQQMVAVARALAGHVRVLLLDEPFEGLAPAVVEELFEAFDRLRDELAIVIVEHNLDLVLALADQAYVLERGSVVHHGPAAALRDDLGLRRRVLWM